MTLSVSQQDIIDFGQECIDETEREQVVFLAGHAPLNYQKGEIDTKKWGDFTPHTLDIAIKLAQYAESVGKQVGFLLLADDKRTYREKGISSTRLSTRRDHVYRDIRENGHALIDEILDAGFPESCIIPQISDKEKRDGLLIHSELILSQEKTKNLCADAFIAAKEKYASDALFIAFVPRVCENNICNVAAGFTELSNTVGMFMDSMGRIYECPIKMEKF